MLHGRPPKSIKHVKTLAQGKGSINIYCNEKEKFKIDSFFSVMETNSLFPVDFTKLLEKSHQDRNYL